MNEQKVFHLSLKSRLGHEDKPSQTFLSTIQNFGDFVVKINVQRSGDVKSKRKLSDKKMYLFQLRNLEAFHNN